MTINIWESLPKNQTNSQTILEAIAALIAEHNNDPDAHNSADQSLYLHRINDIIDHPAGSVKNDKNSFDIWNYNSNFADFDLWGKSGDFSIDTGNTVYYHNQVTTTEAYMNLETMSSFVQVTNDISFTFGFDAVLDYMNWNNNCKVRLGLGGFYFSDNYFLGFEIVGHKIYCICVKNDGSKFSYEIPSMDVVDGNRHSFVVVYDASEQRLKWIVGGNLIYTSLLSENDLFINIDAFLNIGIKLVSLSVDSTEFYFFNPRFSIDRTY